eukprot:TRINITY_DN7876_c0_g1_i1.p2 TRINITY_DN7876_c0_g1~~TRINITY_DN7876_c0_g1_i1.p2  ORF type:complete len:315 (+),score=132.21 TRINITY_DN7876_c0_g1_i1:43-945(+)
MSAAKRIEASLAKIDAAIASNDHYEALQLYLSVARRLSAKGSYAELLPLLARGVDRMLAAEGNAGGDLLKVFFEKLHDAGDAARALYSPSRLKEMLLEFFRAFPDKPSCVLAKKNYMTKAIAVLEEWDEEEEGLADELHLAFAQWLWVSEQERSGMHHFVQSGRTEEFAAALRAMGREVPCDEHDLLYARGVLMCASDGNLEGANELLEEARKERAALGYDETPLVRFLQYLLVTLERRAPQVFAMLKTKYTPSLMRDTELLQIVNAIGSQYYNVQQGPPGGMQNIMASLMGGLMNQPQQ